MTTIADLPPEILSTIFLKLPPKTLTLLTQISKSFQTIIKNPSFISQHFSHFPSNSHQHFLISWENSPNPSGSGSELAIQVRTMGNFRTKEEIVSFRYKREELCYDYKGYVNGLMLISMQNVGNNYDYSKLVLYNPCVRKHKGISFPQFCYNHNNDDDDIGQLGRYEVFLGFDSVEDEHKVVVVYIPFRFSMSVAGLVAVYEVRRGGWRVREGVEVPEDWYLGMKVFVSGVMYWISYNQSGVLTGGDVAMNYTHIVEFDVVRERFGCRKLPGDRSDFAGELITFPFVKGEELAVFDVSAWSVSVWVLRRKGGGSESGEDDCEWSVWRTNGVDSRTFMFFQLNKYQISNFLYCEKIGIFMFELQGVVKSYDMGTHEMKVLDSSYCHYKMDPYVESLLLLDSS